jgi:hypothetical protein
VTAVVIVAEEAATVVEVMAAPLMVVVLDQVGGLGFIILHGPTIIPIQPVIRMTLDLPFVNNALSDKKV